MCIRDRFTIVPLIFGKLLMYLICSVLFIPVLVPTINVHWEMCIRDSFRAVHVTTTCHASATKVGYFIIDLYTGRTGLVDDAHDIFLLSLIHIFVLIFVYVLR